MAFITVGEVKARVIDLLSDQLVYEEGASSPTLALPIHGTQTNESVLLSGIEAALDATSQRIWKPSVFEIETAVTEIDIPDDLIEIEAVLDRKTQTLIERVRFMVGNEPGQGFITYPYGKITLTSEAEEGVKIYYSALWEKPVVDAYHPLIDDVPLSCPAVLTNAVVFYATAYCMLQRASGSAVLRQYNTKVDSGNPEDNPTYEMAKAFMTMFETEMKRIPQMTKGITSK